MILNKIATLYQKFVKACFVQNIDIYDIIINLNKLLYNNF